MNKLDRRQTQFKSPELLDNKNSRYHFLQRRTSASLILGISFFLLGLSPLGCQSASTQNSKPTPKKEVKLEKVEKLEAPKPKISSAQKFAIQTEGADIGFTMDAPLEKIRGKIPNESVQGYLELDPTALASTTGIVRVNLKELELFQRRSDDEGKEFGEETKNETQNKHARAWLEIDEDAPAEDRTKNQSVEFSIRSISDLSESNLQKLSGTERTVSFTAKGDFLLHQHKSLQKVKMQAIFHYANDVLKSVEVSTVSAFPVSLEQHDVRPREMFGKLAQKTLAAMSPKVAQIADVHVKFSAIVKESQKTAGLQ